VQPAPAARSVFGCRPVRWRGPRARSAPRSRRPPGVEGAIRGRFPPSHRAPVDAGMVRIAPALAPGGLRLHLRRPRRRAGLALQPAPAVSVRLRVPSRSLARTAGAICATVPAPPGGRRRDQGAFSPFASRPRRRGHGPDRAPHRRLAPAPAPAAPARWTRLATGAGRLGPSSGAVPFVGEDCGRDLRHGPVAPRGSKARSGGVFPLRIAPAPTRAWSGSRLHLGGRERLA
jgi:hypothetical protein